MPLLSEERLKRYWYYVLRVFVRLTGVSLFRARIFGAERVPREGAVLLLSNHQSHLDPLLVGMSCNRRLSYLARQTLFEIEPLGLLIRSLDAIPIDREGSGLGGLKETMRRLKRGEVVGLFPEGTRTPDGEVKRLKPGFCTLARRCKVTLVPLAIEGAFQSWPKGTPLPTPHPVTIVFGQPIPPEQVAATWTDAELVELIESGIRRCHQQAKEQIQRSNSSC